MLEFKSLNVSAGRKALLSDISFRIPKGRLTVLMGKNGSGKTTLLRAVNDTVKYSGEILLLGKEIRVYRKNEKARLMGYLPQILPKTEMKVSELVALGRSPYTGSFGVLSEKDRAAASAALSLTEMSDFAERAVSTLSGGERQRAYISMLLAQDTPLLLLDEPGAFLDISMKRDIYKLLFELTEKHGKTVLMALHDISEAVEYGEFAVIINEGRVAFSGKTAEAVESGIIESVFSVKAFEGENDGKKRIFFA